MGKKRRRLAWVSSGTLWDQKKNEEIKHSMMAEVDEEEFEILGPQIQNLVRSNVLFDLDAAETKIKEDKAKEEAIRKIIGGKK